MTSPPGKPHPNDSGPPQAVGPSARPWGTAHLTASLLLAAALVWCVLRTPGQTYDFRPSPVPLMGWFFWACGLAYLASNAVLHLRLGLVLRQGFVTGWGEILAWGLADALVTVVAGCSIGLQAESHTHVIGVENLNATLCTAAGLSALLLAATSLRRQSDASHGHRVLVAGRVTLVVHWTIAAATAGGLLYLEQARLAA